VYREQVSNTTSPEDPFLCPCNLCAAAQPPYQSRNYAQSVSGTLPEWKPGASESEAAKLIPVNKPSAGSAGRGGFGGGGAGAALTGFYAQEGRQFVDGKRSVLDIRDAVSAEFGPVEATKVPEYFRGLEKSGQVELKAR
jgi:hypothetical protein